ARTTHRSSPSLLDALPICMVLLAQIPPRIIRNTSPWAWLFGLALLLAVMLTGDVAMGAQRWLDLGVVRFQPSETMKLAVPLACRSEEHTSVLQSRENIVYR